MRKIYLAIFSCFALSGLAQQDLQFTQFQYNRIYYNAGVAGSGGAICINGVHRSQWVGFEGAPTSQNINANVPLKFLRGGLALKIANDQIGFFQNINAGLGYAYQHQLSNGATLGAGFSANLYTSTVSTAQWVAPDGSSGLLDPSIAQPGSTGATFDLDFGIYYESQKFWAGISSARLLESVTPYVSALSAASFYHRRHYYLMGGYNYDLQGTNITLQPSLLLKSDFVASPVVDVNVTALYNNKLWGGVSYRLTEVVAVNIGYQFTKSLKAGYSYDIPISAISQQGGGSHEIFLSYCFKIERPPILPGSYKNVRFM